MLTETKYNGGYVFRYFHFNHYLGQDVSNTADTDKSINAIIQDPNNPNDGIIQVVDKEGNTTQIQVAGIYATGTVEANQGLRTEIVNGVKTVLWGGIQNEDQVLQQNRSTRNRIDSRDFYRSTDLTVPMLEIDEQEKFVKKNINVFNSNQTKSFGDGFTVPASLEIAGQYTLSVDNEELNDNSIKMIKVDFDGENAQAEIIFYRRNTSDGVVPENLINAHRIIVTILRQGTEIVANLETGNSINLSNTQGDFVPNTVVSKQAYNDQLYSYLMKYNPNTDILSFQFSPESNADMSGTVVIVRTYSLYDEAPTTVNDISIVQEQLPSI